MNAFCLRCSDNARLCCKGFFYKKNMNQTPVISDHTLNMHLLEVGRVKTSLRPQKSQTLAAIALNAF